VASATPQIRGLGVAIALYETWRRLPPRHREQLMSAARRHGPRVAASLVRRKVRVKP
jgi:hypothetical protein